MCLARAKASAEGQRVVWLERQKLLEVRQAGRVLLQLDVRLGQEKMRQPRSSMAGGSVQQQAELANRLSPALLAVVLGRDCVLILDPSIVGCTAGRTITYGFDRDLLCLANRGQNRETAQRGEIAQSSETTQGDETAAGATQTGSQ